MKYIVLKLILECNVNEENETEAKLTVNKLDFVMKDIHPNIISIVSLILSLLSQISIRLASALETTVGFSSRSMLFNRSIRSDASTILLS